MQTDTLTYNAQQIAEWQESGDYDYNRELVGSQMNLLEWIMRKHEIHVICYSGAAALVLHHLCCGEAEAETLPP